MQSLSFRSPSSSQLSNRTLLKNSSRNTNYSSFGYLLNDFLPEDTEKINHLLKARDPQVENLASSLQSRINLIISRLLVSPKTFVEKAHQILQYKRLAEHDHASSSIKKGRDTSRIVDSAVPLIQINLGVGCQNHNTRINLEIGIGKNKPCQSARDHESHNKPRGQTQSQKTLKRDFLHDNSMSANTERAKSKSPLSRKNYYGHQSKSETPKFNKTYSKAEQQQIFDKENRLGVKDSNITRKSKTSTPFQVNRLLNQLASPRWEFEPATKTTPTTPQPSARNEPDSKRLIEEKPPKQYLKEILSDFYLPAQPTNPGQLPSKNNKSQMEFSKLLNPSPSFDSPGEKSIEQVSNDTSSFVATSSACLDLELKHNECLSIKEVASSTKSNSTLTRELDSQPKLISTDEADVQEEGEKARSPQNPILTTNSVETGGSEEIDKYEIYTSIELARKQPCLEQLNSTTQKFLKPIPHSFRLQPDTEEKKNIALYRQKVGTFELTCSERASQDLFLHEQQTNLGNSIPIRTYLAGNVTFATPGKESVSNTMICSSGKQEVLKQTACKEDSRIQNQRYSERPSNVGTQLTLSYSKFSQENMDSTNSKGSLEFRDSVFDVCEIDQSVIKAKISNTENAVQLQLQGDELECTNEDVANRDNEAETPHLRSLSQTTVEPRWGKKKLNLTNIDDAPVSDLLSIVNKITLEGSLPEGYNTPSSLLKPRIPLIELPRQDGSTTNKTRSSKQSVDLNFNPCSDTQRQNNSLGTSRSKKQPEQTLDTSRNPVLYDDSDLPVFKKIYNAPEERRDGVLNFCDKIHCDNQQVIFSPDMQQKKDNRSQTTRLNQLPQIEIPEEGSRLTNSLTPERKNTFIKKERSSPKDFLVSFGNIKKELHIESLILDSKTNPMPHDNNINCHLASSKLQDTSHSDLKSKNCYKETLNSLSIRLTDKHIAYSEVINLQSVHPQQKAAITFNEQKMVHTKKAPVLMRQEQRSKNSPSASDLNHHMQKFLASIDTLHTFCRYNQIFIENLLDEIFQYLSEYSVSKNYFVQILTNHLSNFPMSSQEISHRDISLKIFEICDKNNDGIITINDLGENCLLFCQKNPEINPQAGLLYYLLDPEDRGFATKSEFTKLVKKIHAFVANEQDKYSEMREEMESPESEAARMFKDIDKEQRGRISYWDIYMWKDTFLFSQLVERINKCFKTSISINMLINE